jgi:ABC-type glycerol-3-phosphate transport system substrate-binding protein
MRKYLLPLALMITVLVAACGGPAAPPPAPTAALQPAATYQPAPTSAPQPTATSVPQPTAAPVKVVELQFWHAQSQTQEKALKALVDKFNAQHPDIKVTATFQGNYTDLFKKNTAAIAAGSPPDLSVAYQNDTANYVKSDAVIALDDLMKDPQVGFTEADLKDVFPAFIDHYSQFGGKVYSIAFMRSMEVMFYNADMLKSAGFDKPPETWDDFMKVCAALSKPPDVVCYEMPGGGAASTFANWVFGRGGDMLSADGKTVAFDQKPGLDTLSLLNDMFVKKYSIIQAKAYQDQTDFSLGKVVFTFGSTAGLPYYASAIKDANKVKNWGIAPAPHTAKDPVVDIYGPSVTIFKTTPEKQRAAFVFLKWLMDKDANAEWVKASAYFPARASTKASLGDYITANPLYGNAYDWLKYGRTEPTVSAWNPIRNFIGDAMVAVANGKATPDAALRDAAKKANDALVAQ